MQYRCLGLAAPADADVLRKGVDAFARRARGNVVWEQFNRREDLLYRLRGGNYDAVIVSLPGALGMESAKGVRELDASVPLVWISDDEVFALESYRLHTNVFLRAPVTKDQVVKGLYRCFPVEKGREEVAKFEI